MKRFIRVGVMLSLAAALAVSSTGCWFLAGAGVATGTIYVASQFQKCPYCGHITTVDRRVCPACHRDLITGEIPSPDSNAVPATVTARTADPELGSR